MSDTNTRAIIDSARDILVGKLPAPNTQVEQITLAMLYKFMDDIDRETEDMGGEKMYFSGVYEKYGWREIMKKSVSAQDRMNLYIEGLEKFFEHPDLPTLFKAIFKNATVPYRDPEVLTLFLREINRLSYDNSERLGDAYEYLLNILGSQGELGQFRTPRHIIDFIVKLVDPKKNERILDPACGTAGFLISSYKHIIEAPENKNLSYEKKKAILDNITGYDIEPSMVRIAEMNMYLHGCTNPNIKEYDTLSSDEYWGEKYDVILANPPFMTPKGGINPHNKFIVDAKRAEVLFVDYICEHLKSNGRAGIVIPDSILYSEKNGAYIELRKLLADDRLFAIVSLPSGIFKPYAKDIKTSILFLDANRAKKVDKTLMVLVKADGFTLTDTRRPTKKNDLPAAYKLLSSYINAVDEGKHEDLDLEDFGLDYYLFDNEKLTENNYVYLVNKYERDYKINSEYPIVNIGDLIEEITDKVKDRTDIEPLSVSNRLGFVDSSELFNDQVSSSNLSGYKIVRKNYFAYNPSRINVGSIALKDDDEEICVSPMYTVFRIKDESRVLPEFLFMLLKSEYMISIIKKRAFGAIRVQLKYNELSTLRFPIPETIEEQQRILDDLKKFDDDVLELEKQINIVNKNKTNKINWIWDKEVSLKRKK